MDAFFWVAKEAASVLPNQRLQNSEDFDDMNFILYFSYLSDILGVINHCIWPGTLEVWMQHLDFAIKFTTSGVSSQATSDL